MTEEEILNKLDKLHTDYYTSKQVVYDVVHEKSQLIDTIEDVGVRRRLRSKYKVPHKTDTKRTYLDNYDITEILTHITEGSTREEAIRFLCESFGMDYGQVSKIAKEVNHSNDKMLECLEVALIDGVDVLTSQKIRVEYFKDISKPYVLFGRIEDIAGNYYVIKWMNDRISTLEKTVDTNTKDILSLQGKVDEMEERMLKEGFEPLSLAERIQIRKEIGMTQKQTAEDVGCSVRTVKRNWN